MNKVLEDGFYLVKDGDIYAVNLPINFPVSKSINLKTGEVHYPTNFDKIRHMSVEEFAKWIFRQIQMAKDIPERFEMPVVDEWVKWLKAEDKDQ